MKIPFSAPYNAEMKYRLVCVYHYFFNDRKWDKIDNFENGGSIF